MKLGSLLIGLLFVAVVARANDLEITTERKRSNFGKAQAATQSRMKSESKWFYGVKVANNAFSPLPALQARYIIYVQRQELATKMGEGQVESVKGSAALQAIPAHAKTSFATTEVVLREQSLDAGWVFSTGVGQTKATDNIVGIWVRLYDGNKMVGEYMNPTTFCAKHQWEE